MPNYPRDVYLRDVADAIDLVRQGTPPDDMAELASALDVLDALETADGAYELLGCRTWFDELFGPATQAFINEWWANLDGCYMANHEFEVLFHSGEQHDRWEIRDPRDELDDIISSAEATGRLEDMAQAFVRMLVELLPDHANVADDWLQRAAETELRDHLADAIAATPSLTAHQRLQLTERFTALERS